MAAIAFPYGSTANGRPAHLFLLSNEKGTCVGVTDLGACLVLTRVADAHGSFLDVVLGHQGPRGYGHNPMGFGATVGRNTNRIARARFDLDGRTIQLAANEGSNSLHSGPDMWFERLWDLLDLTQDSVTLSLHSPSGDQGFPGDVLATATYSLSPNNELTVHYEATTSERTIINMTNHTYWNLNGHASDTILDHTLTVNAKHYLPTDGENIPLGTIAPVENTPFDLRNGRQLRHVLNDLPRGYDHNLCLGTTGNIAHVARLACEQSGIALDMSTDACGLQVYMAGWLENMRGKDGALYGRFSGIALEPQGWPDAIHHAQWPSVICDPEHPFSQTTVFAFSTL